MQKKSLKSLSVKLPLNVFAAYVFVASAILFAVAILIDSTASEWVGLTVSLFGAISLGGAKSFALARRR